MRKILGGAGHKLNHTEIVFLSEITFLLKTFFFVYIGFSIIYDDLWSIFYGVLLTAALYVARLFVAKFASPRSANGFDKSIIAIMTPKGLAAAVLATIPAQVGMPEGDMIRNITYSVILFSIIVTSVLIFLNSKSGGLQNFFKRFFGKEKSV